MAMDMDPELLKQIVQVFAAELDEQLQVISNGLLKLEKELGEEERVVELDTIFRAAHNVKGAARAIDANEIADIAHKLESLFSQFKQQKKVPPTEVFDLSLEALDRIKECATAFMNGDASGLDLESLYSRLEQAAEDKPVEASEERPKPETKKVEAKSRAVKKPRKKRVSTEKKKGKEAEVKEDVKADESVAKPEAKQTPEAKEIRVESPMLHVQIEKLDQLIAFGEDMQVSRIEMSQNSSELSHLHSGVLKLSETLFPLTGILKSGLRESNRDELREMFVSVLDTVHEMKKRSGSLQLTMRSGASDLGFATTELNNNLHTLRLVPASVLLQGMARSVRDIANELGKKVHLKVIGDEIEMDRAVLNELKAPLIHLLRNAIDHGIEFPDDRLKSSKPEVGEITICLDTEGSEVTLTVADDGHGIDTTKIADIALRKKIVRSDELEEMDERALLDLVFHPGFSTREIITDVSGRGVGLDVVRTTLAKVKGRVFVETAHGVGTTFQLFLPRMLTTERGLTVRAGSETLVIPSVSVDRVLMVNAEEIIHVDGDEALLIDERAVPVRSLAHALGFSAHEIERDRELSAVVIRKGIAAAAFFVDEILDEREIVIKALMPPLNSLPHVMGAAVSASMGVMIVLNGGALLDSALKGESGITISEEGADLASSQRILVVDDSITTRTLEKSVLENRGYDVTVAVDGSQGWEMIQNHHFDLIITDIEMPVMNGFELTTKIKQHTQHASTPVIIVTSLANDADKKRGVDVGADAYIVKSQFESKGLLSLVGQLI